MKRNIKLYAWWYAAFPIVVVFVTLAVMFLLFAFGKEEFCSLVGFVGVLSMILIRRTVQSRKLKKLLGSGDVEALRSFVRYGGINYPTSGLYILAESMAGEYDLVVNHCTKMLKKRKYNRRLEYQWLSALAYCYFDLNDTQKLAEVCKAVEARKAVEKDAARLARIGRIFDFYWAYASRDGEKCQSLLDAAPRSETPIDNLRSAFMAARVAQNLLGDADTAQAYYGQVAKGNEGLGFVRIAKQELQALDAGKACAELPEVFPNDANPLPKNKEYMIWRVGGLLVYFIGVLVFVLASVWVTGEIEDRKTEQEITKALSEYATVSQVDYFELKVKGEVIDGLYVAELDGQLMIGFIADAEQGPLYETLCKYSAEDLQEPLQPIRYFTQKGTRRFQFDLQVFRNLQEVPKDALYVAVVTIDSHPCYVALLSASQIK